MNTYYSPSEQKFFQSDRISNDWVLAEGIDFSDTPYVTVSTDTIDGSLVYYFAVDTGTRDSYLAQLEALNQAYVVYNSLNESILNDGAATAGTTNVLSSIVDIITYKRMFEKPELFDSEGLVAKKAVGAFTQGQALDNELKIKQYAEAMIAETDAFLIRRMKAITNYILGV